MHCLKYLRVIPLDRKRYRDKKSENVAREGSIPYKFPVIFMALFKNKNL